MKNIFSIIIVIFLITAVFNTGILAEENFSSLVGKVNIGNVEDTSTLIVPYITWGGDMATFYGNGGLETKNGSIFQKQGLNLKLKAGDDFIQQVRDYMSGKTPFLRGTFRMMGMASEVIGSDPRTKGKVIMQMTWSAGDHMISKKTVKTIKDLKGKTIVLQKGGPHVGMLDDILKTAQIGWDDVTIIWAKDLTGTSDCPAEIFRTNAKVDCCFVITPDMIGLCGGIQNIGSGAEGTVKGSRVLVSTAELSKSIADVYVCRKDFYDKNKELVTKFVAGYLKSCEEVIDLKKKYETSGSKTYMELLKLTQSIYGKEVVPTLEEDAHGLIMDCSFVGYPGNISFFTNKNNMHGFDYFNKVSLYLAVNRGYAKIRNALFPSDLEYESNHFIGYLSKTNVTRKEKFNAEAVQKEIEELGFGGEIDEKTIVSFTINFEPNQNTFSFEQYGAEYQRVIEMADKYGNAVIAIRGHSDPTKTLLELVKSGMRKGILKKSGTKGNYKYSVNGKPLDLKSIKEITKYITSGTFDGDPDHKPREVMQAALNLSRKRAEAVKESIIKYAKTKSITIDTSQIQPAGVGIREPFIAKPSNMAEAKQNMRVEFRLLRVSAEVVKPSDFDF